MSRTSASAPPNRFAGTSSNSKRLVVMCLLVFSALVGLQSSAIWAAQTKPADFVLETVQYERISVPADHSNPNGPQIELEGWIGLPKPEADWTEEKEGKLQFPVALHSTPYLGDCGVFLCSPTPDHPEWWGATPPPEAVKTWGVPPIELIKRGYAAAFFSIRGTGGSGGCFGLFGLNEQLDQVKMVEWLAGQEWSNGRVAMGGGSGPAATAMSAAIHRAPGLKAIVVTGITSDEYSLLGTPQGAIHTHVPAFYNAVGLPLVLAPPAGGGTASVGRYAAVAPQRLCDSTVQFSTESWKSLATDFRDEKYFLERRLIDKFPDVTAAVLLAHGFQDSIVGNSDGPTTLTFQEDNAWEALAAAPKKMIEGQWGHRFPIEEGDLDGYRSESWELVLFDWLDYWLESIGQPEGLNAVDYQDSSGNWRRSRSWPPAEASEKAIFFSADKLTENPGGPVTTDRTFLAAPEPMINSYLLNAHQFDSPYAPWAALCTDSGAQRKGTGLRYFGNPVTEKVVIAGNPKADLVLSSDLPGGIVAVHLVRLGTDFSCQVAPGVPAPPIPGATNPAAIYPKDIEVLSVGAADLRFHKGNFTGQPFPVNIPTRVKIDLSNFAAQLRPGERLAAVVSAGDLLLEWGGQPYYPNITLHSGRGNSSKIILPVIR